MDDFLTIQLTKYSVDSTSKLKSEIYLTLFQTVLLFITVHNIPAANTLFTGITTLPIFIIMLFV